MIDKYVGALLVELGRKGTARFGELLEILKNPRTLSRKLKELGSLGLVESKDKTYSLSEKGKRAAELARTWFELLEAPKAEIVNVDRVPHPTFGEVLKHYCELLLDHFRERLLGVLVFGSIVRGNWTRDSDIDLLVVVRDWNVPSWDRTRELIELGKGLRKSEEYKSSVVRGFVPIIQEYPLDEKEARIPQRIYIDACVDGVILFERERFLTAVLDGFRKRLKELGARKVVLPDGKYYWILHECKAGEVFAL